MAWPVIDAEIIAVIQSRLDEPPEDGPHADDCLGGRLCACGLYEPDPDEEMERRREGL